MSSAIVIKVRPTSEPMMIAAIAPFDNRAWLRELEVKGGMVRFRMTKWSRIHSAVPELWLAYWTTDDVGRGIYSKPKRRLDYKSES
jgi:hypothetical protein